jgi:hypothetical protein
MALIESREEEQQLLITVEKLRLGRSPIYCPCFLSYKQTPISIDSQIPFRSPYFFFGDARAEGREASPPRLAILLPYPYLGREAALLVTSS